MDDYQFNKVEAKEIKFIDRVTKTHIIVFMVYSLALLIFIAAYQFTLIDEIAQCENNPSRFCPAIYDSSGLVNKPNPNSAVQTGIGGTKPAKNSVNNNNPTVSKS
jgi:hypothetical protein